MQIAFPFEHFVDCGRNTSPRSRIVRLDMQLAAADLRTFPTESELCVTPPEPPRPTGHNAHQLWDQAAGQLAGMIRALGIQPDRVDDVLQDLYLQSNGFLAANRSEEEARRWLFRVAANRCRLEHRQRGRLQRLLDRAAQWLANSPTQPQPTDAHERTTEIDAALDRLPTVQREVVVLRYFCGLNSREAGEVLDLPESTIRSHLAKARRQLARDLADWNE